MQLVDEDRAAKLGFDLLDPTKLLPEEVVPITPCGRLVLNRNPENFFAECEQVAFHPGNVVPGIDFSNDPLLQGRLFSYTDAQLARLGGPNHHELPINRGVCPVHNFQRDGRQRAGIARGRVSYEPNTLANGSEFRVDGGEQGFQTFEEEMESPKIRRRSPSFDDHFGQATLFWNSQSTCEKEHIIAAFQYELSKVETPAIRQRMVDNLAHVDARLARKVAEPLGIGPPDAKSAAGQAGFREPRGKPMLESAPSLSMELTGNTIQTRRVAIVMGAGVELGAFKVIQQALLDAGATTKVVAAHLGFIASSSGQQVPVDHTFQNMPSVMFDAVLVPGGTASAQALAKDGAAVHFVLEAYKHCKPLCLIGESVEILRAVGVAQQDAAVPAGVIIGTNEPTTRLQMAQDFIAAIARHRHWSRALVEQVPA
jgi:catalase